MIRKYLAAETKRISAKFMAGATTKAEWEKVRPRLKREFLDMLGINPPLMRMTRTPLKATVTGTLNQGDVTIEKLHYPGLTHYVSLRFLGEPGGGTHHPSPPSCVWFGCSPWSRPA